MGAIEDSRDGAAAAALEVATELGVSATFSNPGDDDVSVKGIPVDRAQVATLHSGPTDYTDFTIAIPRQTDFPPSEIKTGAAVTYDGVTYGVEDVDTGGQPLSLAPVITLQCKIYGNDVAYEQPA